MKKMKFRLRILVIAALIVLGAISVIIDIIDINSDFLNNGMEISIIQDYLFYAIILLVFINCAFFIFDYIRSDKRKDK